MKILGRAIRILSKMGAALDLADAEKLLEEAAPESTSWDPRPGSATTEQATVAVLTGTSVSVSLG
jgi:hypothetical protein